MKNLLMLIFFLPVLIFVLLFLNFLFSTNKPDPEKLSLYECGEEVIYGQTRSTFNINFYIIAMLFLIFDLEILLLFPISVTLYQVGFYGFSIAIIFFIILTIGFVYEIGSGVINLSSFKLKN